MYFLKYDFSREISTGFLCPQHTNANWILANSCIFKRGKKKEYSHCPAVLYLKRKKRKEKKRTHHLRCYCRDGLSLSGRLSCRFYRRNNFCYIFTSINGILTLPFKTFQILIFKQENMKPVCNLYSRQRRAATSWTTQLNGWFALPWSLSSTENRLLFYPKRNKLLLLWC